MKKFIFDSYFTKKYGINDIPEVLNVHVNESKKKSTLLEFFLFKQWKINFCERKCEFFKYFLKFQFILFNCGDFFSNFIHMNVQHFRYMNKLT